MPSTTPQSPTNVHVGFPGKAYQIEVFAPEKGLALRLVTNEKIKPVPSRRRASGISEGEAQMRLQVGFP